METENRRVKKAEAGEAALCIASMVAAICVIGMVAGLIIPFWM